MANDTPPRISPIDSELRAQLDARILVIDGAMGTMIQGEGLVEADYRGERFADHAVEVARRVIFQVTGHNPDEEQLPAAR